MDDIKLIENELYSYIPYNETLEKNLIDSMAYSLKAGGKRIRPRLVLEFYRLIGDNEAVALPFGCALEMIHTYSLIHDDLPCMDDDDMRRGKPSNHKVFGEDIALLAGDALQSLAFEIMTSPAAVKLAGAEAACKCVNILASYCGALGMVGGQVIDLENESKSAPLEVIREMDIKKTGGLIKAACEMGCALGKASEEQMKAATLFGENIGISFQIMDDILDVTSSAETLGKPIGSDIDNDKTNYVSLLGIDRCRELVDELTDEALKALDVFDADTSALKKMALELSKREK
jgi:geranylgeranyl diphosphate synthase type II